MEEAKKITRKQLRFIDEYLIDFNATRAFKSVGYKYTNDDVARALASRLVSKDNVKNEIAKRLEREHKENAELKTKIRRKYEKIAFLTIDQFLIWGAKPLDDTNIQQSFVELKNLDDINPEYLDCIKKVKQTQQGYSYRVPKRHCLFRPHQQ